MSTTVILAAVAAFGVGCVFCVGLWWISAHRSRQGRLETMKAVVWLCLVNGIAWVWCSYLLAYLGREQIAEQLSKAAVTEIMARQGPRGQRRSSMTDLTVYIPILLTLILAMTLITNIVVQVLKSLTYEVIPTNLLAFLVAVVVTGAAFFALYSYFKFIITGWMIVAVVALAFLVAFAAMFGYDKLVEMLDQLGWIRSRKE